MSTAYEVEPESASDYHWTTHAKCAGNPKRYDYTPNLVSDQVDAAEHADAIRSGCPVKQDCLEEALRTERGQVMSMRFTIRGGLTPRGRFNAERRQVRGAQ